MDNFKKSMWITFKKKAIKRKYQRKIIKKIYFYKKKGLDTYKKIH